MKKDKKKTPETDQGKPTLLEALVFARIDKALQFPSGWDQHPLKDEQAAQLREYLRENHGADQITTQHHYTTNRIIGKPVSRRTAIFFAQTVQEGELISEGKTYPARKGLLVILPSGADFRIRPTFDYREIIEFTF